LGSVESGERRSKGTSSMPIRSNSRMIVFDDGLEVQARPSDAIALALRTQSPIVGAESVLDEAGIEIPDESEPVEEDQVEKFREFLDQVTPEDFGAPGAS